MRLQIDYGLDMWGNPYDGFDCNNVHHRKEIEVSEGLSDRDLIAQLADANILSEIAVKMFNDGDLVLENDTIYERVDLKDYEESAVDIAVNTQAWPFMPIAFLNW